jgi:hypothetical protein
MTIFLILAPYGAFATLMLVTSATVSLFASAAICLAMMAHDAARGRSVKMLGAGSAIVFLGLGTVTLIDSGLSASAIKLCVDAGMLAIALTSLAIRQPFTLQYAREMVDPEIAQLPGFVKASYVITAAWAVAFALMVVANLLLIYIPGLPLWLGLAIAFAARNTAVYFTKWYPEYRRIKLAPPTASRALPGS